MNKANHMKKPQAEHILLFLLIVINLVAGIATLPDYGESWDEARLYEYADQSLAAYRALFHPEVVVDFGDDDLRYYGPAYLMGMSLLVRSLQFIFPGTSLIDLWHFGNFACLQFGLVCFYFLARRFMEWMPALAATALFASQPLIWGHGFINPKDVPFMVFFTASLLFGLNMMDEFERQSFAFGRLLRSPWLYTAVLFLGLTISIRILGFAAGFIVLFYLAFVNHKKVLRLSYVYFGAAIVVCFFAWPYLWPTPASNFTKAIYAMLEFQWVGQTLFNGVYYPSTGLPTGYVPQLLLMQLTEPALVLFFIGMTVVLPPLLQNYRSVLILFVPWFAIPMLYILVHGMNLYDNARQLLFILPAAFLVIAAGLDFLFTRIKPFWTQVLTLVVIVLPGAVGIVKYHPFEYSYYNHVTTSNLQIFRKFETDYWATSFKQASTYLNDHAPRDSLVVVWGPAQLIQRYARRDIRVKSFDELTRADIASHPYFLVLTTRYDMDQKFFPDVEPVYTVQHLDLILAVVRYITP